MFCEQFKMHLDTTSTETSLGKVYGKLRYSKPFQVRGLSSKLENWKCLTVILVRAGESDMLTKTAASQIQDNCIAFD